MALRQQHLRYSKLKLAVIYERLYGAKLSSCKIQKVIQRHQLYAKTSLKRATDTVDRR